MDSVPEHFPCSIDCFKVVHFRYGTVLTVPRPTFWSQAF